MAINIPSTAFAPCTITLALSSDDRAVIERQIEALIDLLDRFDGDPDLEDDELNDDALDLGEETRQLPDLPVYAIDQRQGPLNFDQAYAQHRRATYGATA